MLWTTEAENGRGLVAMVVLALSACVAAGQCVLVPTFGRTINASATGEFVDAAGIGGLDLHPSGAWRHCRPASVVDPRYRVVDHRLLPQYDPETWAAAEAAPGRDEAATAMASIEGLLRSGHRSRALRVIEGEMRAGSEDARLWRGAGALLLGSGRLADGAQRLHEAHSVDPLLAMEPLDVGLWFRGGEREARRRASALRRIAEKHGAASQWVSVAVVSMWCGDMEGAGDAIERARGVGADAMLCDQLMWGVDVSVVDETADEAGVREADMPARGDGS